jgi:hypothetical protein
MNGSAFIALSRFSMPALATQTAGRFFKQFGTGDRTAPRA